MLLAAIGSVPPDKEIKRRLQEILDSEEFRPQLGDRLLETLVEWFNRSSKTIGRLSDGVQLAIIAVCLLLLAGILIHLVLTYRGASRPSSPRSGKRRETALAPVPEDLLTQARTLAASGRYRDAARALQQAVLVHQSAQRGLPWRPHLSDWEWLQLLGPREELVALTRETQALAFGAQAGAADFARCEARATSLLQGGA